jgi:hypothetical protein
VKSPVSSLLRAASLAVLLCGAGAGAAFADVAAVLDSGGNYLRTEVRMVRDGRLSSVWLAPGRTSRVATDGERILLNQAGARRGDGTPSIAVHPLTRLPWAVWSYNEGGDRELALSLFDGHSWSAPILLGNSANGVDDLEPKLAFSPAGQPYIVSWRLSPDGADQSVWVTTRSSLGEWLDPVRLTSARLRASRPSVLVSGNALVVAYDSDRGIQIETYTFGSGGIWGYQGAGGTDGSDPPAYGGGGTGTRTPECPLLGCTGD